MTVALLGFALATLGITPGVIEARGLTPYAEPAQLVVAERHPDGRVFRLTPEAAAAWQDMKAHAAADGVELIMVSAFRSVQAQVGIFQRKLAAGETIEEILRVNAPPGYSQHHSGRAIDIGTPGSTDLDTGFERTEAFRWLQRHAHHFGFFMPYGRENSSGYAYEPWHWLYAHFEPN